MKAFIVARNGDTDYRCSMTTWRPHPHVRVVAIGLHWRDGRLLAAEVRDDAGRLKGVRPLGGEIEFGESWRTALASAIVSDAPIVADGTVGDWVTLTSLSKRKPADLAGYRSCG